MTINKRMKLAQSLLNRSKSEIKSANDLFNELGFQVELSEFNSDEFIEIRLDNSTLTCQIDPNDNICFKSVLFPDDDSAEEYIEFCDQHYVSVQSEQWLNNKDCTAIEIKNDPMMGTIISFEKL